MTASTKLPAMQRTPQLRRQDACSARPVQYTGPLNRAEKQAIIDRELTNLAFVGNRSWYQFGRGDQKPLVDMTPEELMSAYRLSKTEDQTGRVTVTETPLLSKDQRELLEKELRDRGIPVTPSTIANLILRKNAR
jgi:hypothetical protein